MVDQMVRDPAVVRLLRAGPLGAILDDFVRDLEARGHAARTIRDYVREAGHLARWMASAGHTASPLSASTVLDFLHVAGATGRGAGRSDTRRPHARPALRRLLVTLQAREGVGPALPSTSSPVDALVQQFLAHATRCRGVSAATRRQQGHYVRQFLAARFPAGAVDLAAITAQDLRSCVAGRAEQGHTRAAQCAASALRGFVRFLVLRGLCADSLVGAVPTVAHRGAGLPRALSGDQVRQLLASFDRAHPLGCRDHAIALCLARLGLRVGEVVGLRLEDIAWRAGTICIAAGKSRRAATLPLPAAVGRALAHYIRDARPGTADRHVFIAHGLPVGRRLDAAAARSAIRRAFDRAGLHGAFTGTHALRHTVATHMICQGASLKEVADVLRHRSLNTTAVYARVHLPALRGVAMPWPEVC